MNMIRMKALSVLVALIMSSVCLSSAPSGKISGSVVDNQDKKPLPGANVFLQGTKLGASTDLNGNFVIPIVPVGRYKLVIRYIGYQTKTIDLNVAEGQELKQVVAMDAEAVQGEVIVVTAQAEGQLAAINQQLASDKIANVVSEQRIQELPDFNAAQALSRLPGVSTLQSSGEANKVVIRGLAPQYNQITVGGVSLASTGSTQIGVASQAGTAGTINNDRSVDLSMLTPYMIKSISVYKALTPDLNANSLGGTVNMELREAPSELHTDLLWQSGYTDKSNTYGNYRFVGSASKRFLEEKLGVYALGNIESYDRDADNMNGSYIITNSQNVGATGYLPVRVSNLTLNRHFETRKRYGANLILDYRLPAGSLKLINLFSRLNSKYQDYRTVYDYQTQDLSFGYRGGDNNVDVALNSLGFNYNLGRLSVDLKAANNYSRNELPEAPDFRFAQTRGVGTSTENTIPENLTNLVTYSGPSRVYLNDLALYSSDYKENGQTFKSDFKLPFNLLSTFTGYIKFGGEYDKKLHKNAQTTPYVTLRSGNSTIQNNIIAGVLARYPQLRFDSTASYFAAANFTSANDKLLESFLGNKFGGMLWAADPDILKDIVHYIANTAAFSGDSATAIQPGGWFNGYFQTLPNTYAYDEKFYAGYLMSELNIGNLMVVGGVRYEEEKSQYDAYNLKDGRDTKSQTYYPVTAKPGNKFWLPMVQARYNATNWFDIRYAYTQTLARPDYHQLSPHFTIAYSRNIVRAGNPNLKPAHSYNHDVIFTFHSNTLGLLSIGGFYKTVRDFTYSTQYGLYPTAPEGLYSISSFDIGGVKPLTGATLFTYINTPYDAHIKGLELDFQTRLLHLPAPFNGTLLGINYTRIKSEATYPWRDSRSDYSVRPPKTEVFDSTRTGRLIRQPNDILNAYIGYDYRGFSVRLSFVFQGNSVSNVGNFPEQDGFTRDYFRLDASVKQLLPWHGTELFLDLNNLNSETNTSAQQSIGGFTNEQNYGFLANLGARYRF